MLKEKWDNLSINRERKRKIDEQNRKLILEIQKKKNVVKHLSHLNILQSIPKVKRN